jgi:hypothetical protein
VVAYTPCVQYIKSVFYQIGWNMTILALQRVKISLRLRNCCKDSIMRIVGNLQVLTGRSRDMLLQAKGDPRDRVHSDQMVLAMIRRGRLVR